MDTVIFLRTIFWVGFIVISVGITIGIEFGARLVSALTTRFHEKGDMKPEQLSLFDDAEMMRTG